MPDNLRAIIIIMPVFQNGKNKTRLRVEKPEKSRITNKAAKMELK